MVNYQDYSKEELLSIIQKQAEELKNKKYGLVWDSEREPEQVVLDCENNLPILTRVKGKEIRTNDEEDNILIEGDNYHALTVLNYTHTEKIDLIYIDPPYNTGNGDFKYNDKYVEKEDGYRHSKWLNFIEKRLNLAKNLLTEKGLIFISIDDNEQSQLKLLCDKIFGEDNFITNIVWQSKTGSSDAQTIDTTTEYILVYTKNLNKTLFSKNTSAYKIERYRLEDEFKSIRGPYYTDTLDRGGLRYSDSLNYSIKCPDGTKTYPNGRKTFVKDGWTWKWGSKKLEWGIKNGYIVFKKTKNKSSGWSVYYKNYLYADNEGNLLVRSAPHKNLISDIKTGDGASDIKEIFGNQVFKYSKPVELVSRLVKMVDLPPNPVILDFMAGSGTTGHGVLDINSKRELKAKFILCTNNENKICEEVTYPRLEKVIKGYKKNGHDENVEGLGGNLQYFRTGFVKRNRNQDQMRVSLTSKCTEMLCVKENIFNLKTEDPDYKIFSSNKNDKFLCVYYNFLEESFEEFLKEIKKLNGQKIIYMFSIDGKVDKSLFSGITDFTLEEVPQKIMEVYRQIIKMNLPVKVETMFLDFNKANKKLFEDKDKDESARLLRVVLEKLLQKTSQINAINILSTNQKEEKVTVLNDKLKAGGYITQVEWEENRTCLTIGNHASHGEYHEYEIAQVEHFYQHLQSLINKFNL